MKKTHPARRLAQFARDRFGARSSGAVCNLCKGAYRPKNKFTRFCPTCRQTNELYRLAEWLPAVNLGQVA